jgi:hypothetical protein
MGNLNGIVETFIAFGIFIGLCLWGGYALIDHFFIDHRLKSDHVITPTIELVIEENKVDTLYVYELK